ncbi:hypothetical protein VTO58DRAFT_103343 [Aureobasidium pullulans]
MSEPFSRTSSLAEDVSDTKRIEDDAFFKPTIEDDGSSDVPEAEKDPINVRSFDDDENKIFKVRAYQDEMLAESLKRNTIVVLNTGAGKTHMTRAELELDDSDKLVWFLAPTVALCHQHYKSVKTNLPAYQTRLLTSEDGVDRWTDQTVWDGVLKDIKIIISTYGVLYDALCHGFVAMKRLSLCVFDEAHHCTKKHASNMIMQQFYRPAKDAGQSVPRILGLSASPVMNAKAGGLEVLETNMDSHAITPRLHRSELMQYVHIPGLMKMLFQSQEAPDIPNSLRETLTTIIHQYKIREDPYLVELIETGGPDMKTSVNEILMSRKTYCTDQLRALRTRAEVIATDISPSASETYIQACRDKFLAGIQQNNASWMPELSDKEKGHLAQIVSGLRVDSAISDSTASPKLQLLLEILRKESGPSFTGIIFVEQRAVVAALAEYLTSVPEMSRLFNIGTFVGGSNSSKKKSTIGDINDLKAQQQTLDDFRIEKKNLIIATSVLEEGIDISSCQTVICFDAPLNLVSFVQRRGRARKKDSKYIILLADDDIKGEPAKWNQLEDRMKAAYEDEYRNAQLAAQLEQIHEADGRKYEVPSTGALLTLDNAKSHLYHFCATLQTTSYVDHRPILEVTKFPKKRDFLTQVTEESRKSKLTREQLTTSQCTIDLLPVRYSFFAACIPSILHKIEAAILAARLQTTLLAPIGFTNLQLIIEATTSGNADFTASYERLEYLGDAVLKYCTHIQLSAQHPEWPESYLTAEKGRTNGNASLSRACLSSGVDRYISTTKFTGNHWKPPLLPADGAEKDEKKVDRSTKTLADVVEALIGASYIDKGLEGALSCIRIFLPNEQWLPHSSCLSILLSNTPALPSVPPFLSTVEKLIGYKFTNPSLLLEALTDSSFSSTEALSYERLEFLGDAVLDQILVPSIFAANPALKNHEMHRMRQALANAHILGICSLELSLCVPRLEAMSTFSATEETPKAVSPPAKPLWRNWGCWD